MLNTATDVLLTRTIDDALLTRETGDMLTKTTGAMLTTANLCYVNRRDVFCYPKPC